MCLAVPGQLESIYDTDGTRMGKMDFGGVTKDVCLSFLPQLQIGEYAIVHVGFAISQVDEASAQETIRSFEELGLLTTERPSVDDSQTTNDLLDSKRDESR